MRERGSGLCGMCLVHECRSNNCGRPSRRETESLPRAENGFREHLGQSNASQPVNTPGCNHYLSATKGEAKWLGLYN